MYRNSVTKPTPALTPASSSEVSDIEQLLDEVENAFLTTNMKPYDPKKIVVSLAEARACPCTKKTETNWDEVDELLKEFKFEDTNPFSRSQNKSWARPAPEPEAKAPKKEEKCYRVYLAGSYEVLGCSTLGYEKPCNNLKCLRCDFVVQTFDNYAWDPSTDYLFLRNNMPDFEKVAKKLRRDRGSRAYACQCVHVAVKKITNVGALTQVRWVCGKHAVAP